MEEPKNTTASDKETKSVDPIDENATTMESESSEKPENENTETPPQDEYSHLDFLNDTCKGTTELFTPYSKEEQSSDKETSEDTVDLLTEPKEAAKATDAISMFHGELDLNSEHSYDNLFNGNSDEHYFQAFRENNLHLLNDLNENKMDSGEDILKLLHSPLDFLNDKFLK